MITTVFLKSLHIHVYVSYFMDFKERNHYAFLLSTVSNIRFTSYIEFKCIKGITETFQAFLYSRSALQFKIVIIAWCHKHIISKNIDKIRLQLDGSDRSELTHQRQMKEKSDRERNNGQWNTMMLVQLILCISL